MSHQYSVLLFGSAKAAAGGAPSVAVHAPTPTLSPSALRDLLAAAVAGADWRGVLESAALAVDQAYVAWDDAAVALSPRSEIAVIPAVSGG